MCDHRDLAHAILRLTIGMVFLLYGIGKFRGGASAFAEGLIKTFQGKLPTALLIPFAYALPYAEVILGALLILGLFTTAVLALAGLLIMTLTFGLVIKPDPPTVVVNLHYALIIFALLYTADRNGWSLEGIRKRT